MPHMLYVSDRANGDFSVILDSERCVIINHSSCIINDSVVLYMIGVFNINNI